ncbi:MAG: ABC transporter permease [Candidatus Bathyarchaeia archaeon]
MSELRGIYTLWLREVKRYTREKTRLISSFIQPLLWLVIFGSGMRFAGAGLVGITYQQFIFPGIVGQTLLFTSMFMGISVIWDREFGFLKEILVAPISRISVFVGKMLGGSTDAVIQGSFVFVFSFLVGIRFDPGSFLVSLPVMLLITFGLVSIGLTLASLMGSLESFGVIQTFVNLPLFFLSGALFPLTYVPQWLRWVSVVDPLTYGVDALRVMVLKSAWVPIYPLYYDLLVLVTFDLGMICVGTAIFSHVK